MISTTTTSDQGLERLELCVFDRTHRRAYDFAKMGQGIGVQGIGFCELPRSLGKVTHLARVDNDPGKRSSCKG